MIELNFKKMGGLIPAVAQDYASGEVLMLGFMNEAAWEETLATGKATYFSRTRNTLWTKGNTSGNVQRVREIVKEDVLLLIGGFHLMAHSDSDIRAIVARFRELNVAYICPTHCSGDAARKVMKTEYGERCIEGAVGRVIRIADLVGQNDGQTIRAQNRIRRTHRQ